MKEEAIQDLRALINIAYKRKALLAPEAAEPYIKALEADSTDALGELRKKVDKEIEEWQSRINKHSGLLHEVSGIVGAWLQMRQMIDAEISEKAKK